MACCVKSISILPNIEVQYEKLLLYWPQGSFRGILFSAYRGCEHHIVHCGVTEFIVGNYGGFDRMAARAVISAKALYPGITLLLLLSYTGFTERIRYIFRLVI